MQKYKFRPNMKKLTIESAREYAIKKFKKLPELYCKWNIIHSQSIIEILKILTKNKKVNKKKLFALAWVHDIGKIISEQNHAQLSIEILKKDFYLDAIDIDCILNHGSSKNPKTKEGKIFRYADGLSMFTPLAINFRFFAEAKEGLEFEEIIKRIEMFYKKYRERYQDSKKVIKLLDDLYKKNVATMPTFYVEKTKNKKIK